jgi:hypothetical protein
MRLPLSFKSKAFYLWALVLSSTILLTKAHWDHQQVMEALDPYFKELVPFKLYRPDNHNQHYIEDLVQIQISKDASELLLVRHTPHDDELRLPIEEAQLQTNKTVMLLTHRNGSLYRIYLNPQSFMLSVVSNRKSVVAMETGTKISAAEVQLFKEDPFYRESAKRL